MHTISFYFIVNVIIFTLIIHYYFYRYDGIYIENVLRKWTSRFLPDLGIFENEFIIEFNSNFKELFGVICLSENISMFQDLIFVYSFTWITSKKKLLTVNLKKIFIQVIQTNK